MDNADRIGAESAVQTIEQIEQRAAEIDQAERAALRVLAEFLRELAVRLPVESRMPLTLAKAATSLRPWFSGGDAATGVRLGMWNVDEYLSDRYDLSDDDTEE